MFCEAFDKFFVNDRKPKPKLNTMSDGGKYILIHIVMKNCTCMDVEYSFSFKSSRIIFHLC